MGIQLSLVFPLFNEEKRISSLPTIVEYFRDNLKCDFELILVCNGCTDRTVAMASIYSSQYPEVRVVTTPIAGRGNALKLGFLESFGSLIAVCAIDRSWDESFYLEAKNLLDADNLDVIYGPKSHPSSTVIRPFYRTLPSWLIRIYISIVFQIMPVDTNCIKIFKRDKCRFLGRLGNFNYFAETEFYLRGRRENLRTFSIPVVVNDSGAGSKVRLSSLLQFVSESIRFKFSSEKSNV